MKIEVFEWGTQLTFNFSFFFFDLIAPAEQLNAALVEDDLVESPRGSREGQDADHEEEPKKVEEEEEEITIVKEGGEERDAEDNQPVHFNSFFFLNTSSLTNLLTKHCDVRPTVIF